MVKRKIKGKNPFFNYRISIRVWPDKYRIDLEEIKRCPTSHLVGETGEIVPYCLGLILNNEFFSL